MEQPFNSQQQFNRQQQEEARVSRRAAPIKKVRISAVSAATAQTIYTVPAKRSFELKSLMISNITAANVTFSIYAIAPGGSPLTPRNVSRPCC